MLEQTYNKKVVLEQTYNRELEEPQMLVDPLESDAFLQAVSSSYNLTAR